ncbi:MAG: DNA-directed polymerase sigma-70 factor [Marmoricola sp.]|nr:DNA-directed polymerase sigma-70 factor [Marmoricola sp.]
MTVTDENLLAEEFETHRARLRSVAYRMLGTTHEADDAVQEAWLRLQRSDGIDNLGGWLTTVVSRVCLDMLRSRSSRREHAFAEIEDEPALEQAQGHPEFEAELADSVGSALLVVLQSLAPAERLAFVLHDLFAVPFEEISSIIGRSPTATRQLASRARRRVQRPEEPPELSGDREVVEAFLAASRGGDFERLLALLDPGAVVRADAAAVRMGSDELVTGAHSVAETFAGRARAAKPALIDGSPGAAWMHAGDTKVAFGFTVVDGRILEIELLADPDVLSEARVQLA